jgi:1,4-dihydroxy-2-naphthoyl-CoA hydrolase
MTFNYSRRVYLSDTDAAGVVYFAKGLEICHEAYEESLAVSGISLKQMLQKKTVVLPIVHAEIDFMRPLFCGDRIQVSLTAYPVDSTEFAIVYQILANNLDSVLVTAQTRHVCINPKSRTRINLPAIMNEWLNSNQAENENSNY